MLHLPSMLIYGFLSFSMAFLNKALFEISDFRNSLFVIFIQLVFVILSFQILGYIHLMPIPIMTKNDAYTFLIPSIFYSLSTILSLQALMKLNVAIYVVIKRCTPALTFVLSSLVLKKQKFDLKIGLCVFAITLGATITSMGDLTFHMESYLIGTLSVIFQSLYLLTVQRCSEQKSSSDVLYINSLISLPMVFILMILFTDDLSNVLLYEGYKTFSFWFYFLASTLGGGLLNGSTFWCIMKNSALTTSVAGVLKSVLQVFFGLFVFDRLSININTIIGIALSLVAGTMFTYMEYTSKQRKSDISMNDIHDQEQNQPHINSPSNTQDITTNTEKSFVYVTDETRVRRTSSD
jgi:drug/metabolite transporter (DMT)-like permease